MAPLYLAAGWLGALPLPKGQKNPPPTGYTGKAAPYPTPARVEQWREQQPDGNVCLRLAGVDSQYEVIGIDVDQYIKGGRQKLGHDQLRAIEQQIGCELPATWISTSRTDGMSGKRFYRVPRGLRFKGQIDKDIECIQKRHRFAVVWPSYNPDSQAVETWFPPGAPLTNAGRSVWDGTIPDPRTLPLLPDGWIDVLTNGRVREDDEPMDMDSSVDEVYAWADNTFHGEDDTDPCALMRQKINLHKHKIASEATSHDKITNAHMNILHLAREGHVGWNKAINEIEDFYARNVIERDKRDEQEVRGEIRRSRTNGFRKVKGFSDRCAEVHAIAVHIRCDCDEPNRFDGWAG